MAEPVVKTSTRLWSQEVAIAESAFGDDVRPKAKEPGYEWSNGRKFDSGPGAAAYQVKPLID